MNRTMKPRRRLRRAPLFLTAVGLVTIAWASTLLFDTVVRGHVGLRDETVQLDGQPPVSRGDDAQGHLVGVSSGRALAGVVSHPGERTHLHDIAATRRVFGHGDADRVAAGGVLRLPA
jgi:hypothetical protein